MPKKLPKRSGALEPHQGGPPKARPLFLLAMTVKTYDGARLTEKRLHYREKIREGLWREFDQTVVIEPEALPGKR